MNRGRQVAVTSHPQASLKRVTASSSHYSIIKRNESDRIKASDLLDVRKLITDVAHNNVALISSKVNKIENMVGTEPKVMYQIVF